MVLVRDVTLRDGLQDEKPIATEAKLALFDALVAAGVSEVELTSFVRPDRVPAMADAEAISAATAGAGDMVRWGLVLNRRGAERALAAGLRHLQFVCSVSEAHNLENAGRTVAASLAELAEIVAIGQASGAVTEGVLATAFGCPFSGPVPVGDVQRAAEEALASGIVGIALADTIGTAVPTEVAVQVRAVLAIAGSVPVGVHLHDTRGLALANALTAIDAGAVRVDAAVGGLGGCPFAPGASGNLATEDLVHALEAMGMGTGIDLDALIGAAHLACDLVGRPVESHVGVAGPRFRGTPFAQH
jgi:hydroxymethylglutaryl-CoA lyase